MRPVQEPAVVTQVQTGDPLVPVEGADVFGSEGVIDDFGNAWPRDGEAHPTTVTFGAQALVAATVKFRLGGVNVARPRGESRVAWVGVPGVEGPVAHAGKPVVEPATRGGACEAVGPDLERVFAVFREDGGGHAPFRLAR